MKKILPLLLLCCAPLFAETPRGNPGESTPSAQDILAFAREQLPKQPIRMNGSLKERAPNGFVKKELTVEMDLNWGADPANATYRIRDEKTGIFQTLEIQWLPGGADFQYSKNNAEVSDFDPNAEINGLGVTWADLSFSFLWTREAKTLRTDKKLGRDCFVLAVPRGNNRLLLWIEQETGRVFGAQEETADGKMIKEIKVVSVKEFDKLWMVKDLDIIRPLENSRTTLRVESVEVVQQENIKQPPKGDGAPAPLPALFQEDSPRTVKEAGYSLGAASGAGSGAGASRSSASSAAFCCFRKASSSTS